MKYLFVVPVSNSIPRTPWPGIPSLISILDNIDVETEYLSLDFEYINWLDKEKIYAYYKSLQTFYKNKEYVQYPEHFHEDFAKHKQLYLKQAIFIAKHIKNFEFIKKLIKLNKYMYNYILYIYSYDMITFAKNISLLFSCYNIFTKDMEYFIKFDEILTILNSPLNNLKDFYQEQVQKIITKNPDIVGIQITKNEDLLSGLYLSYLIKQKKPNIHINIGGNFFEEYYKTIKNIETIFGIFCDSISIGDSTQTVIDLTKFINKEIVIENVNNLLYLQDGKIKYNQDISHSNINHLPFQSFNNYKKDDYFSPELVLPMRASTTYACYWGKCIYCAGSARKRFYQLMSAKRFVDEIEYLSKKYNTKYFAFWDNALHPKYIERVADLLLERKLKIKYNFYARFEDDFSHALFKKLKKSGCVAIHWGLDSASEKMLKYINKGINIKNVEYTLKYAKKEGIYNFVYLILGYPTETIEDLKLNLEFVQKNIKNIDFVNAIDKLLFIEGSIINENKEYYKNLIKQDKEFIETKNDIIDKINKLFNLHSTLVQWNYLYIAKYGWFKYNIINFIMYYYFSHKNTFLKKILDWSFKFVIDITKFQVKNHTFKR